MNRVYNELVTISITSVDSVDFVDSVDSVDSVNPITSSLPIKEHSNNPIAEGKDDEIISVTEFGRETAISSNSTDDQSNGNDETKSSTLCRMDSLNCFWTSILTQDLPTIQSILLERPHYAFVWDGEGESPLHVAAKRNQPALITVLLDCGCDPTMQDEQGRLAFSLASSKEAHQAFRDYRAAHPDQYVLSFFLSFLLLHAYKVVCD